MIKQLSPSDIRPVIELGAISYREEFLQEAIFCSHSSNEGFFLKKRSYLFERHSDWGWEEGKTQNFCL